MTASLKEEVEEEEVKERSKRISAKEKLKQKLEKKKSNLETRNPRLMRQQSSRVEDRLKVSRKAMTESRCKHYSAEDAIKLYKALP